MNIIERIKKVIEYKQISTRKFCIEVGVANGFFDKVKDVGSEKLLKILNTYPEISAEWLLAGKGNMIKSEDNIKIVDQNSMDFFWDRYDKIVAERDRLRDQVSELQREKRRNSKTFYTDDQEQLKVAEPTKKTQ